MKITNSKNKILKIITISLLTIILFSNFTFATTISNNNVKELEYSEEYKKWLKLSDEEKEDVIMPNMYDVEIKEDDSEYLNSLDNIFKLNQILGASVTDTKFDLRDEIEENLIIKNQGQTGGCWAFAMVAALETTFARNDKTNGEQSKVYDFSERHMVYGSLRKAFLNNAINEKGLTKEIYGGNKYQAQLYLTNGSGAISESEMQFENNENLIDISKIQNKNVITTLIDAEFIGTPKTEEQRETIMQDMKQHISKNGGIWTILHGAQLRNECYNNNTAAIYTNDSQKFPANHAALIIGWDDEYNRENFNEKMRPQNNGAWIIKNSWGSKLEYSLTEYKEALYNSNQAYFNKNNIYSAENIPNSFVETNLKSMYGEKKVTVAKNKITIIIGDNGFMYVSYEDANIMNSLYKIIEAKNYKDYDNIYQYDYLGVNNAFVYNLSTTETKAYIANVFETNSNNEEITKVSISSLIPYEKCRVYINPNGNSKKYDNLQLVDLAEGEYEKLVAGYNTIEFANPIKITGNSFVVVVELSVDTLGKFYVPVNKAAEGNWQDVKVVSNKSFIGTEEQMKKDTWTNVSDPTQTTQYNLTIKAFTNNIEQEVVTLSNIEIEKAPAKTKYNVGEKFDKTGMIVNAIYTNGTKKQVNNYTITNGDSLELNQKTVTISYTENNITKTITQPITVVKPESILTKIEIKANPTKLEYLQNKEDLNLTGGIIKAIYSDGKTEDILMTNTAVKVTGYNKSQAGKQIITVTYKEKITTFEVTVKAEVVLSKIEIKECPSKIEYIKDKEDLTLIGGVVTAIYSDGKTEDILMTNTEVKVTGYDKSQEGKQIITVTYKGKTATFEITVKEETVDPKPEQSILTKIQIKTLPSKLEYVQNKENLNLTGGIITLVYSDEKTEDISMTNAEVKVTGYDKTKLGKQIITVTYEGKTTTFEIIVKEEISNEKPEVVLTKIQIKSLPVKLEYIQNKENLDLTGGIITLVYSDEKVKDISMTNTEIKVTGFDKTKSGKQTIRVTYKDKVVTFEIVVKEIEKRKPTLSSFTDAKADITKATSYIYIKKDKIEYALMTIKLDKIQKGDNNSTREFYYYLSGKKGETNIANTNWVKFDMNSNDETYSTNLNIDTRNIKNASEIAKSESIYIYIKEVAKLDGNVTETVNTINIQRLADIEVYLDDIKQSEVGTDSGVSKDEIKDDTIAQDPIPQTGIKTFGIVIIALLGIGIISYIRYKNIDK